MYSPLVVGASNTHNYFAMANKNKQKHTKVVHNHSFKGLREVFLNPGPGGVTANPFVASVGSTGGTGNTAFVLAPMGLTSTTLGASSYTAGTPGNVMGPPLRGLYNRAIDFQWYRVTRARFIFVGSVTSTTTGVITLTSYTDPGDLSLVAGSTYSSNPSTRTFDFANASNKELSVPVPVDSSWKRCSSLLSIPGNVYPFTAANAGSICVLNTVADLSFGACSAQWTTTTPNIEIGRFFIDYDIEFKGPIDSAANF